MKSMTAYSSPVERAAPRRMAVRSTAEGNAPRCRAPRSGALHTLGKRLILTALFAAALLPAAQAADEHDHEHGEEREHTFTVEEMAAFGVKVAVAGPGQVDLGVELPGEIRPNADRVAHIAPRFPGLVREVRKRVGDQVRAGEVLAVIESENLTSYEVKSAFEGTVIDSHIAPGEAVDRGTPAFIVADLSTVWVELSVYQKALSQVRVGQPVRVATLDGSVEAEGRISYIAPIVDQATRTATARVVLPNPSGVWRPGLFVTANVLDLAGAAIVVPRRALHTFEGGTVVFTVEEDRFVPRPVTVGRTGPTRAELLSGVSPGDAFADEGSFLVKAELAKGEGGHDH